jgi:hypothetical protein
MTHCIDYRQGSMGNTILAHALFACNQIDIDLTTFFSESGNAHAIYKINQTNLIAWHLIEHPKNNVKCVLEVISLDWWEVLRIKMSYQKWFGKSPTASNISTFYNHVIDFSEQEQSRLWQEFYTAFKDPSWPDCVSYNSISTLSLPIQQEINNAYTKPIATKETEAQFVEWLTVAYYDGFCKHTSKNFKSAGTLLLGNYVQGRFQELIDVCTNTMNWTWDSNRSQQFYNTVAEVNRPYLEWLEQIKQTTDDVMNKRMVITKFDPWEQAIIVAKTCEFTKRHPLTLNWNDVGCNTDKNNLYLDIL